MKTFPFVPFSTFSRVQAASAAYLRYRFSTRECIYTSRNGPTRYKGRIESEKEEIGLFPETKASAQVARPAHNNESLSLPGMESGLPDPPGGRRNNGKRAYYYFIIAHICRNAYLPLHYRGHLRCELLRLVTGTLLYISDTLLRPVQSNEIQNRR